MSDEKKVYKVLTEAEIMAWPVPKYLDKGKELPRGHLNPEGWDALTANKKAAIGIMVLVHDLTQTHKLSLWKAMEVNGNSVVETAWYRSLPGNNLGGWKVSEDWAKAFAKEHGVSAPWWRAAGHQASGDPPVCFYRGFLTPGDFLLAWLGKFVPKTPIKGSRYNKTGECFWQENEQWFLELCKAGYKGVVTAADPDGSVVAQKNIVQRSKVLLCQLLVGTGLDADWGAKSGVAAKVWLAKEAMTVPVGLKLDKFSEQLFQLIVQKAWVDKGAVLSAETALFFKNSA